MKKYLGLLLTLFVLNYTQAQILSTDSTKEAEIELGEVIIEASRDGSRLKDMPTSVTSIKASQLENHQIKSLEDISSFAPNFMMLDYGTKIMSPIYIRGFGSKKSDVGPSVGVYVDGIPYYDNSSLSFDFYDIASVEVLRGPQGTLYGRNTIGGLININTLSPMDYQGTNIKITGEEHGAYSANIGHYGKVSNRLAYSIAGNVDYQNGYFKNQYNGSMADSSMSYGFRGRLIYQVNDELRFENVRSFEKSYQGGYPYGTYVDSTNSINDVNYNRDSYYSRTMYNEGLLSNYENDKIVANATLSFQSVQDELEIDQDFKPSNFLFTDQDKSQKMYSLETTVGSKNKGAYNWMFGSYGLIHQLDKNIAVDYYAPYNSIFGKDKLEKTYAQTNRSGGIFHQSKYQPIENLTITAGLRMNIEQSMMNYTESFDTSLVSNSVADTSFSTDASLIFLPKLAISYKISDEATVYTSYATGYKPGGFNSTFENDEQIAFGEEISQNIEAGVKVDLFEGLLYADATFFYSYITGQHVTVSLETRTGTYTDNSAESKSSGAEFSLNTRPIKGFELALSYGLLQNEFIDYKKDASTDYNGNINPYAPQSTYNVTLSKIFNTRSLSFLDDIRLQANIQGIGDTYWDLDNSMMQEAYTLVNGLISFNYQDFSLDLWGKNLTNTIYNTYMFKTSSWFGQQGLPTRLGATLSMKF